MTTVTRTWSVSTRYVPGKQPIIPAQGNGRRMHQLLPSLHRQLEQVVLAGIDSGKHTNGPNVAAFERAFKDYLHVKDVVAVNSGSSALLAACQVIQLAPGSEIIVPSYTFIMTVNSILNASTVDPLTGRICQGGLIPVFADVDCNTGTLDPEKVQAALTPKTRAIMPVHLLGQTADMRPLLDLAEKHDLYIIEDAAQAAGATYQDPKTNEIWMAGSIGDMGCFSLSSVKNMGSLGDAGALTITQRLVNKKNDCARLARAWRDTGRMPGTGHRYIQTYQGIGARARMDEFSALQCLEQLQYLPGWNKRRREIAAEYSAVLAGSAFRPLTVASGREHTFFAYMVQAPTPQAKLDLMKRMLEQSIEVADVYTVVPDQDPYQSTLVTYRGEQPTISRDLADTLVQIPCYPELCLKEIERIKSLLMTLAREYPASISRLEPV